MENTCGFVHLHNHTMYSLLDGAIRPKELTAAAADWGMGAIAITDHGNMFGAVEFYLAAQKAGIKPIIGSEVYVAIEGIESRQAVRGNIDGANHLVLLAETDEGYRNLMKLVSIGYTDGFYYKPRVDKNLLRRHHKGLIALSACLGGEVSQLIIQGEPETAAQAALEYVDIFGEGNFYLELQDHGIDEDEPAIAGLVGISRDHDIPLVATNDAHYLRQEHADSHDVLLCIATGKTLEDRNRMRMETDQIYLKSPDEMKELFAEYPDALANTVDIAERCDVTITMGEYHPVRYDIPPDFEGDADAYLAHVAKEGLVRRYGDDAPKYMERLEYELDLIARMGFPDYFLALYDCTKAAREMDIPVGTARGSAGGSIVAYATGITNLDPMAYGLIFERFLNPERVSMPDIDIDYADRDRGRMINYVKRKYGDDHVCQIITFGTMKARAVIRDVGRVLNMPYGEVDAIAKLIPSDPGTTLDSALEMVPEIRALEKKDDLHRKLFFHARTLEGLNRHAGTHAAGVIITPGPCTDYLPVYKPQNEDITSQYTMEYVEKIGCLKVDFLGLRNLTVIKDAVDMAEAGGAAIDIDCIPLDDPAVYELMSNGDTVGVFQFESGGMRDYLRKLKPTCIEDLIAMNALYRPGPLGSNMVDDFIDRKHGRKKIEYPHPVLEDILKETYGVIVYQEQVMKIANVMGGFSLGAADQLRRAMGKKKVEVMVQMREQFIRGANENGIGAKTAGEVFDLMAHFAGYGFNKSHSAGYAIIAFQTAWLKVHYPAEFMAANLTSEMDNTDRIVILIDECRRMGIEVLPPDVNRSFAHFTVDEGHVRFGLGGIKNVGLGPIESIIEARSEDGPFADLYDFCARVDRKALNKRMIESLIMAGAMDSFGIHRARLVAGIDQAIELAQAERREREAGQFNLFGGGDAAAPLEQEPLPDAPPWTALDQLAREKSVLGFWFTGNPLDAYREELDAFATPFARLFTCANRAPVTVGGVITGISRKIKKSNNKPFMVIRVTDREGTGEAIIMNGAYDTYRETVAEDSLVLVDGTVANRDNNGDQPSVFVNAIEPLEDARRNRTRSVTISLDADDDVMAKITSITGICERHPGDVTLWIRLSTCHAGAYRVKAHRFRVSPDRELVAELREVLGGDHVRIG